VKTDGAPFPGHAARVEAGNVARQLSAILRSRRCDLCGLAAVIHTPPSGNDPKTWPVKFAMGCFPAPFIPDFARHSFLFTHVLAEWSTLSDLIAELLVEKLRHQFQGFFGFRELKVIPEGVGQCLENHQPGVDIITKKSAMEQCRVAQQ
jgi:hypothetical protein